MHAKITLNNNAISHTDYKQLLLSGHLFQLDLSSEPFLAPLRPLPLWHHFYMVFFSCIILYTGPFYLYLPFSLFSLEIVGW